jgi:exonuclease SbcC
VRVYEATLADAAAIEAGLARLRALRTEEAAFGERAARDRALADRRAALERAVAAARGAVEVRRARSAEALAGLTARLAEAEGLLASRDEIAAGVGALRSAEADETRMAQRLDERLRLTGIVSTLERQVTEAEMSVKLERERLATRLADAARRADGLAAARTRLEALEGQLAALERVAKRRDRVFELGSALKARLDAIPDRLARLAGEIQTFESRVVELSLTADGHCPLCEQGLAAERRAAVIARLTSDELDPRRAERAALEKERPKLDAERRKLGEEWARLGRELAPREQLAAERSRVAAAAADAEAAVGEAERLRAQVAALDARLGDGLLVPEVRGALTDARRTLEALAYDRGAHDRLRERIQTLRGFETRQARLDQAAREAAALRTEIPEAERAVTALDRQLADGAFAETERAELARLAAAAGELGYDSAAHAACRAALAEHEPFERRAAELAQAVREVTAARAAETEARAEAASARDEAGRLTTDRAAKLAEAARLPDLDRDIAALDGALKERRAESGFLRERLGRADARLADLARQAEALEAARVEAAALAERRRTYADLAKVLGKNGVQAIIIENALPEIEDEANRLLGRLTDHAMRLKLETQRDKKTGGVAETLEIRIADEQGTRPYETFSGGEAFRVNFALRIALSRLLARRAGAKLQTLVIDEGFGTQDQRGTQKLVEAIHAVEQDFARVLVITHIEDLKNAFPARIEVEKDPIQGSTYRVV